MFINGFEDRYDAADRLAVRLESYRSQHPLIMGIPRGAVPMAQRIAAALGGEFDVVLVRKLGAPGNPEYAIGAVAENGWTYLAPEAALAGATAAYLEEEKARQMAVMDARRRQYDAIHQPRAAARRCVIVVDDGLATGATMIAALHSLRDLAPGKLVCAVPVAPRDTLERIAPFCDEIVCLQVPERFHAVGEFYARFEQVSDAQVLGLLRDQ